MNKVVNNRPQLLPNELPNVFNKKTITKINQEVASAQKMSSSQMEKEARHQNQSNETVPVLDLRKSAKVSPAQQLADIMYQASPERAKDISSLFKNDNTINNIIDDYGHADVQQAMNFPSARDMSHAIRDIYSTNTGNANTNQFLRLEELYSYITGSGISGNKVNPFSMKGLFTDIDEPTMSGLYEVMYGAPMNSTDYYDYIASGNPMYYHDLNNNQLTNTAGGKALPNFNEVTPDVMDFQKIVDERDDDNEYRKLTDTPTTDNQTAPINPITSTQAPQYGFDEIRWVLQIGCGPKMPVEAATYLTSLNIDKNHKVLIPDSESSDFALDKYPFSLRVYENSLQILSNVISKINIQYGKMPKGSLITLINQTALQDDHPGIYTLVKKTILDLYALCYSCAHSKYLQYITYSALIWLRLNIRYLKIWSSHYWEYRDFIEIWEDLDESVAYIIPRLNVTLGSTNNKYSLHYYNDNQNNVE